MPARTINGKPVFGPPLPPHMIPWWSSPKYTLCEDGSSHEGKLELVTWNTPAHQGIHGMEEELGWGACILSEVDYLKEKFNVSGKVGETLGG
jgi:hypothetical protein